MWESPIYKLNKLVGKSADGKHVYKEIVIDVTGSAPDFDTPRKTLEGALGDVIKEMCLPPGGSIMDFGAGKLRVTLHLLRKGYSVSAVEYEKLFQESNQAAGMLSDASRFSTKFNKLVYPHQFERSKSRFDLVLLINVLNVMPVPVERRLVLSQCHEKLRKGGFLLWYTQRGDAYYKDKLVPEFRIGDGYFMGRGTRFKTFYREFTVAEIDELLSSSGFEYVCSIDATSRNQARLYQKLDVMPLASNIDEVALADASIIDNKVPLPEEVVPQEKSVARKIRKGNPDPVVFQLPNLLINQLKNIPTGKPDARTYQNHVKAILEYVFVGELKNFKLEVSQAQNIKRLDITARNKSKAGFFHSLKEDRQMKCPIIVIECKNYEQKIANPEMAQIGSRLGRRVGSVGILTYRSIDNRKHLIKRCSEIYVNSVEGNIVIPLSDNDLTKLIRLRADNKDDDIETYMDDIVDEVVFDQYPPGKK